MTRAAAIAAALVMGYVAGVNAPWVSNAVYVARVTRSPFYRVLDPLHRHWLDTAAAPFHIEPVVNDENTDDELLARTVESDRG